MKAGTMLLVGVTVFAVAVAFVGSFISTVLGSCRFFRRVITVDEQGEDQRQYAARDLRHGGGFEEDAEKRVVAAAAGE